MTADTDLPLARPGPWPLALCGAATLLPLRAPAGEAPVKRTYTYKTVGDVKIQADVYRPDDANVRPVVVWLHGGALIVGSRAAVPKDLLGLCRAEGYALVSFDYRLAPEVKLPAILDDLRDAFRWLREEGPKLFHADPVRVAGTGGSAGGYLTLYDRGLRAAAAAGAGRLLGPRRRGRRLVHAAVVSCRPPPRSKPSTVPASASSCPARSSAATSQRTGGWRETGPSMRC
jgi:hypothetical protein